MSDKCFFGESNVYSRHWLACVAVSAVGMEKGENENPYICMLQD